MVRIGSDSIVCMGWIICIAAFSVLLPTSAQAEDCSQWDMSGIQQFDQSNGYAVQFRSKQAGSEFHGIADNFGPGGGKGLVDGSIDGDDLKAIVVWDSGSIGVYTGRVNTQGYPEGITHDRTHPESTASWTSKYKLDCLRTSSPLLPPSSPAQTSTSQPAATPPPATPADPLEKFGVVKKPGKGIGEMLKETKP